MTQSPENGAMAIDLTGSRTQSPAAEGVFTPVYMYQQDE
jgi:hypothetical protein